MNKYKIFVCDFKIDMFLGLHEFEQEKKQPVLLSIEANVVYESPDQIYDYDKLIDFLRGYNAKSMRTQEQLVGEIYKFVINSDAVTSAIVSSKKPDIFNECKFVGVTFSG